MTRAAFLRDKTMNDITNQYPTRTQSFLAFRLRYRRAMSLTHPTWKYMRMNEISQILSSFITINNNTW